MARAVAWALTFAALGFAVVSWFTPKPELDARDAIATAVGALAEVGYDADAAERVRRAEHVPEDGDPLDVWVVTLDVAGDEMETRVLVDAGQLVYVDDRIGPDGQERLLTDDEFHAIADYRHDATRNDWFRRNVAATVAGALIAAVSFFVAKRSDGLWPSP